MAIIVSASGNTHTSIQRNNIQNSPNDEKMAGTCGNETNKKIEKMEGGLREIVTLMASLIININIKIHNIDVRIIISSTLESDNSYNP